MTGFWLFTSLIGYRTGWGCPRLFYVCGWFEWTSSGVVGFYDHKPSWSCSLWLRNCLQLRSVGCRPNPCTWWNTDLQMTDVPDLVWVAVVALIGNLDHSSLSAVISKAQAVINLCVSRKVFLKNQVNWNTVCGAILELQWRNIWLADNPLAVLNEHLSLLVGRYVPTKYITSSLLASSRGLIFRRPVIALWLTGKSLSAVKWELKKPTRRTSVSLMTKTGMFLWMFVPLISGGPLLSLRCLAGVRYCLRSLVRVVDCFVSRLVRLICCRIILTANSPGRLLICHSLAIHFLFLPPLRSGRVRWGASC